LLRNLSKFITQTGLYCCKQLETTFHQFCEKPLHITFKVSDYTSFLVLSVSQSRGHRYRMFVHRTVVITRKHCFFVRVID